MKYIVVILLVLSLLGYASYYLYMFDKRVEVGDKVATKEQFTLEFWKNITPEQLKEKLKDKAFIKSISDSKQIHLAVYFSQFPEMISLLVDSGIDYTVRDAEHQATILHWAVIREEKAYEFAKEILKYIDVNAKDKINSTVLNWAVHNRSAFNVIKLLLDRGANPNPQIIGDWSALMTASIPNTYKQMSFIDSNVIKLLLDYKADMTVKNNEGKTALDYMKENEEFSKTELFKKLYAQFH